MPPLCHPVKNGSGASSEAPFVLTSKDLSHVLGLRGVRLDSDLDVREVLRPGLLITRVFDSPGLFSLFRDGGVMSCSKRDTSHNNRRAVTSAN